MTNLKIGLNIKKIRKERNLSQNDLAKLAGISRGYLGDVEQQRSNPSLKFLNSIAVALDLPLKEVIGD